MQFWGTAQTPPLLNPFQLFMVVSDILTFSIWLYRHAQLQTDVTTFLYCEYNYHCYEYYYNYNTWMYSFQVDSTTNLNIYVSDHSSSKQKVWLRQTTAFYIYLFFNFSSYFSAVLVCKVCKCIFAITTSNYSFH